MPRKNGGSLYYWQRGSLLPGDAVRFDGGYDASIKATEKSEEQEKPTERDVTDAYCCLYCAGNPDRGRTNVLRVWSQNHTI